VTRRDQNFVVYVWSKGTHSCIHPFVYFLRREGGGFQVRLPKLTAVGVLKV